jgi:bla regulator protein BlaR1
MILDDLSSLANHLWQSSLCVAVAWLLTLALRKNRAAVRYWIWLAASVKFLVPFSMLVSVGGHFAWRAAPAIRQAQFSSVMDEISRPFALSAPAARLVGAAPATSEFPEILLFGVWLCGFSIALVAWLRWWRQIRALRRAATPLDLNLPIPVMSSAARLEPGVFGIREPVLLLPEGIADRLTPAQLEAVLAHELCHVRRRDNLTGAIHMVVEAAFWFHPLTWWIGSRLVEERERACDEEVLRASNDPETYAEGILNVCKFCLESPLVCVSGVTGADLKTRIEAIMANHHAVRLNASKRLLLAVAAIGASAGPVAIGMLNASPSQAQPQATARLEFEVASVKPFKPGSQAENRNITVSHGTVMLRQQTLRECIAWAYGLKEGGQLTGPDWLDSEQYDITAKAGETATEEQLRMMLQSLLAERFKLTLHQKTEQRTVYALVVGKNGPKLREVQQEPTKGFRMGFDGGFMTFRMVTNIARLVDLLPTFLDRPVLNRSGLTGVYEFTLKVEMDAQTRLPQPGQVFMGFGMTPGIFTAVEDLGLKLVSEKAPLEILVIDHVERPSEN